MNYFKAVFDLRRPLEEKIPEERDIYIKMSVIPLFVGPPVPYPDFLLALDAQDLAVENAQFGGLERINTMRAKERVVDDMMRQLRTFVSLKADGDTELILSSGFRHTKPRQSAGSMPKVEGVKNQGSEISGTLKLKWKPVPNASFYEVQVAEVVPVKPVDPPVGGPTPPGPSPVVVVEKQWVPISTKPSHIEIKNLKPLTYYEVRVRANGAKGFGAFSDVLAVLVV